MEKGTTERPSYDPDLCPFRHVLAEVGDKWSLLVVFTLKGGEKRFSEVKREIGDISQRMLTQTLRNLERDGYVHRTVTPSVPPRVDYRLTEFGQSLCEILTPVARWALESRETVAAARAAYAVRTNEGHMAKPSGMS